MAAPPLGSPSAQAPEAVHDAQENHAYASSSRPMANENDFEIYPRQIAELEKENGTAVNEAPTSPPPESPTDARYPYFQPKAPYDFNAPVPGDLSPPPAPYGKDPPRFRKPMPGPDQGPGQPPGRQDTGLSVPTMNMEAAKLSSPHYHQEAEDGRATPPMPDSPHPPDDTTNISPEERLRRVQLQLFDACKQDLFHTSRRTTDPTLPKTSVLNLATLQHGSLHMLQRDLAVYASYMYYTGTFIPEIQTFPPLQELLDKYCTAVRNLDYMKEAAKRGYDQDPFLMKSSRGLERLILETVDLIPRHVLPIGPLPPPNQAMLSPMGRNKANREAYEQQRWLRFGMAAAGGLLLIVPVLIMANVPGKIASLTTTCVSMLVFAVLITSFTELDPNGVLAATAGYAAVLVVFVGTTTAPSH